MTWYNPMTWFPAPKVGVYVRTPLDKPLGGITLDEPANPYIYVQGLDLETAARELPGRSINWHSVPLSIRTQLELSPNNAGLRWDEMKGILR